MKLPNKINPYHETIVYQMVMVLKVLKRPLSPLIVYSKTKSLFGLDDLLEALTCLYAIGKIELNEQGKIRICSKK